MRYLATVAFALFMLCVANPRLHVAAAAEAPNVLLIVGDDWGWTDFGFMGSKEIKTPNLDKLAAEGATFPNGYVPTSLCRASLATILTGQFAHQHKICCNDPPEGIDRSEMLPFLRNSPSLPRLLQAQKYSSLQTGKFWEGHYKNGGFTAGMTTKGRHGEEGLAIGRKTMQPIYDFVDNTKGAWFIWYAPMMPHQPHTPPDRILQKYAKPGIDPRLAKYRAMCEWTDETIGDLLAELKKRGKTENLLTLFVVDNGWVQSTGPVKPRDQFETRSKNTPYDMGVRTPLIVYWPGHTKPGRHEDLVSTVDIAPTILQACGVKTPKDISGMSLLEVSAGKGKLARTAVFGEIYVHTALNLKEPRINLTHRWVRTGNWKLIVSLKGEKPELFDLVADPQEQHNVAADKPEVVAKLTALIKQSWNSWPEE